MLSSSQPKAKGAVLSKVANTDVQTEKDEKNKFSVKMVSTGDGGAARTVASKAPRKNLGHLPQLSE